MSSNKNIQKSNMNNNNTKKTKNNNNTTNTINTITRLRNDFPILKNRKVSYLDNAATTQKPKTVINSIQKYYENNNANTHRGIYKLSEESTTMLDDTRKIIAKFINAEPQEIIFTKNSTEALNNIANSIERSIKITNSNNIVTTIIEHHSNFLPWQQLAKRKGATFRIVDYDSQKECLREVSDYVDNNTIIVAFTGMSNVTGLTNNIKQIITTIRKKNNKTIIIVDATQLVAHERINVKELDVDVLVFSGHKIYGPTGVGIIYCKTKILETLTPFNYGGNMVNIVELMDSSWAEIPEKFEGGTIDTAGIIATGLAIQYIDKNFDKIIIHEKELLQYTLSELKKISGLKIIGHNIESNNSNNKYGPVISITIEGVHPHDIATICDNNNVCVRAGNHCAQPFMKKLGLLATTRISIGVYNNKLDIDKLIIALKESINIIRLGIQNNKNTTKNKHPNTKVKR